MSDDEHEQPFAIEKSNFLELGTLMLELPELYKLGARALHASTLVYHIAELAVVCAEYPAEQALLRNYCRGFGIGIIRNSEDVSKMMAQCIFGISSAPMGSHKDSAREVGETIDISNSFLQSLNKIIAITKSQITLPPNVASPLIDKSVDENFSIAAKQIIDTSTGQGRLLDQEISMFKKVRASIHTWTENFTISTHAGGFLKLYWPPAIEQR